MRKFSIFILLFFFAGVSHAACSPGAEVAMKFMNQYVKLMSDGSPKEQEDWLTSREIVTENFVKSYQQLLAKAQKEDPELGLDFDPIVDAQDYPEEGFGVFKCAAQSNYVTLAGKKWRDFKVVVKVMRTDQGWRVDGAGVVNVPNRQRARR